MDFYTPFTRRWDFRQFQQMANRYNPDNVPKVNGEEFINVIAESGGNNVRFLREDANWRNQFRFIPLWTLKKLYQDYKTIPSVQDSIEKTARQIYNANECPATKAELTQNKAELDSIEKKLNMDTEFERIKTIANIKRGLNLSITEYNSLINEWTKLKQLLKDNNELRRYLLSYCEYEVDRSHYNDVNVPTNTDVFFTTSAMGFNNWLISVAERIIVELNTQLNSKLMTQLQI